MSCLTLGIYCRRPHPTGHRQAQKRVLGNLGLALLALRRKAAAACIYLAASDMAAANPLHQACEDGDLALVRGLLGETPVDQTDTLGSTPLYFASRGGHAASNAHHFPLPFFSCDTWSKPLTICLASPRRR